MSGPVTVMPATVSTRRVVTWLCHSLVVTTILTSRLALPFGGKQVPLTLALAVLHLGCIAVFTGGAVSLVRLFATLLVVAVVVGESLLAHATFSTLSVMYVLAVYVPLVVTTRLDERALHRIWRVFIGLMSIAALLGLVQILVQVGAGGYFPDPIGLVPESLQLQGYATTYPIMNGVLPTLKPNGMLFVEPSTFSQFTALALIGELALFHRKSRIALLTAGLAVSFSGTGLLMVFAGIMVSSSARVVLAWALIALIAAALLVVTGFADAFARVDELRRPGTSGHERFVAPYAAMTVPWTDSVAAVVWGYGAGRVEDVETKVSANYSPVPKVTLEYGLLGLLVFGILWAAMFSRLAVPRSVTAACLVMYFLAAGSLLQPFTVFSLWGLTAGFRKRRRPLGARPAYP